MLYFYYDSSIIQSGIGHNMLNITYYHNLCIEFNAKFILLDICFFGDQKTLSTTSELFLKYIQIKNKSVITNVDEYTSLQFTKNEKQELFLDGMLNFDVYTNNNNDKMYWITNEWNNNLLSYIQNKRSFYDNGLFDFSDYFKDQMNTHYKEYFNMITCHVRHGNGEICNSRHDLHEDRRLFQSLIDVYNNLLNSYYMYNNLDKTKNKVLIISDNTDVHNMFNDFNVINTKKIKTNIIHININSTNTNLEEYFYECLKDIYLMSKSSILLRRISAFSLCTIIFNPNIEFM